MTKYEYSTGSFADWGATLKYAKYMGDSGWELVCEIDGVCFFQRKITGKNLGTITAKKSIELLQKTIENLSKYDGDEKVNHLVDIELSI